MKCPPIPINPSVDILTLPKLADHARSKIGGLIRYLKTTKHEEQSTKHEL
jgi:hypothetical protein